MTTKDLKKQILQIQQSAAEDIRSYMQQTPCEYLNLLRDDNISCKLRVYDGKRYPTPTIIDGITLREDGTLLLHAVTGENHPDSQVLKEDLLKLHEAFEQVTRPYTPQVFCDLVNRCEDFPVALHDIIDRQGWTDYAAEDDAHLAYDPATRTLMTWDGGMPAGTAICTKKDCSI